MGLCIGISWTEPSLLENAITVHWEIFQIKHWNINKRVIRTYFLKKKICYWKNTIRPPIQGLHCVPRYKDKDLKPRTSVSNGLIMINHTGLSQLSSYAIKQISKSMDLLWRSKLIQKQIIQVSCPKFYIVGITGIWISKSGRNRNKPWIFGMIQVKILCSAGIV